MRQAAPIASALAQRAALGAVHVYRAISTLTPGHCRHEPTCSQYALTALRRHGVPYGGWLTVRRLARCHPLGSWGFDPVPPARGPGQDRR